MRFKIRMYDLKETHKLRRKIIQARKDGRFEDEKQLYFELGTYFDTNKKYEEALDVYKKALSTCEKLGDQLDAAIANRQIGETYINLGQFDVAVKYVDACLMYFNSTDNKIEQQKGYALMGQIHLCRAKYVKSKKSRTKSNDVKHLLESSLTAFEKSFSICEKELENVGKREKLKMKASLLQNLGFVIGLMGNFEEGNNYLTSAIQISRSENFKDSLFWCYMNQGELFLKANDEENALTYFSLALSVVPMKDCKIDVLQKKAAAYLSMGNYSEAKNALKEIYLLKSGSDPDNVKQLQITRFLCKIEKQLTSTQECEFETRKKLYKKMGDACCTIQNYKQAIKSYLKMLHCAESNGETDKVLVPCYNSLAQAYKDDEQYDLALKYCLKESELTKDSKSEASKSYLNLGELYYYLGYEYEIVHDAYKKALELAREINDKNQQIKVLDCLVDLQNNFGHFLVASKNKEILNELKNDVDFNSDNNCSKSGLESDFSILDLSDDDIFSDTEIEIPKLKKYQNKLCKYKLKVNEVGETELQSAVIKGDYKKVKSLIDRGHPVNVRDTVGWTPLHEACNHGYVDIVDLLLNSGADINDVGGEGCDGITPLHDAAENGHFQVIDMLLKRGASSESLTKDGRTPLDCFKHWRKRSSLIEDEEIIYFRLCERLKSKLDSEDFQKKRKSPIVDATTDESDCCSLAEIIPPKMQKFSNGDCNLRYRLEDMDVAEDPDLDDSTNHQICEVKPKRSAVDFYKSALSVVKRSRKPTEIRESPEKKMPYGAKEYKLAIEGVRQRRENKRQDKMGKKKSRALLNEEEVVDDWLEDDLGIMNKPSRKRRAGSSSCTPRRSAPKCPRKRSIEISDSDEDSEEDNPEIRHNFRAEERVVESPIDLGSEESEHGFEVANIPEIDLTVDTARRDIETVCDIPDTFKATSPLPTPSCSTEGNLQEVQNSHEPFKITVRVPNETLQFSVPRPRTLGLTCEWLVEEVAERYTALKNITDRKPNFVITLTDGAILVPTEALDSVEESELEAKLLHWKRKTLYEAYEEQVHKLDDGAHCRGSGSRMLAVHVAGALGLCETSNDLSLRGLGLTPRELLPILKTIQAAKARLGCLDLSRNNLGDKGIPDLVNCLRVCAVERLLLASNNITRKGMEYFSEALGDVPEKNLCQMKVLDVSFNTLTEESADFLKRIRDRCKNLVHLGTSFCELERFDLPDVEMHGETN